MSANKLHVVSKTGGLVTWDIASSAIYKPEGNEDVTKIVVEIAI